MSELHQIPLGLLAHQMGWDQEELQRFRDSLARYAPRGIRLRPDRTAMSLPFQAERVPWFQRGWWITSPDVRPSHFLEFAANDYYIQDAGSLLPVALLCPEPHEWICDVCAAPGGKASAILEQLDHTGWLLANETIKTRLNVLRWNLERTGQPWYALTNLDSAELGSLVEGVFDAVLVDAPCSGQVLVISNKRSDNAFAQNQIQHSAARQRRILENAIRLLRVGGRLVYSTCTFSIEENEEQIAWLQDQYPGCFEPIDSPELRPWRSPLAAGCYRVWPHRDPTDGAFAGALRLISKLPERAQAPSAFARNKSKSSFSKSPVHNDPKIVAEFGALRDPAITLFPWERIRSERKVQAWDIEKWLSKIEWPTYYRFKGSVATPEHALAILSPERFLPYATTELDLPKALRYVRGESLDVTRNEPTWSVATWMNRSLGWLKIGKLRANNGLPSSARESFQSVSNPSP